MVRILVLSFLFKGESFSFVKGLWLLDLINRKTLNLINRKTFLWIFLRSPLHLVFLDGDWKVFCFLAFGKLVWDLYIFRDHVLSTGGWLQIGRFCRGSSTRLDWFRLWQGVFISFNVIYDCILLLFCRSCFSFMIRQIWYCWRLLVQERGRSGHLEQNVGLRTHSGLLKLIGIAGIIIIKESTCFSR